MINFLLGNGSDVQKYIWDGEEFKRCQEPDQSVHVCPECGEEVEEEN